jgi:methyl-accepting chemotaxis protein
MAWFNNLKIATKLLIAFLCVAIISGVVGIVGIMNLNTLVNEDKKLYENFTVPMEQISSIARSYLNTRIYARDMIIEKDARNYAGYIRKCEADLKNMKEELVVFSKTVVSDEGRRQTKNLENAINAYEEYLKRCFGLIQAGQGAQAYQMFQTEGIQKAAAINEPLDWLINAKVELAKQKSEDNKAAAQKAVYVMIVFVVVAMLIALGLGFFIARAISRPIGEMVDVANKIAAGDLDVEIAIQTKDEIGTLAQTFNVMAENVNRTMTNINDAAEQVAAGAHQIAASGQALSQGSTEQASSIEEITASMTEVAAQTKQNAVNAGQANELAISSKEQAVQGNSQMQEMVKAMAEINDSSANISKIIKVIDEIAFQTNILALNAAVEAARAGQHGKGFAVVAEEVRNLAARSANAAKETTTMIEGSIKKVEVGTQMANRTAEALDSIVDGVSKAAALVGDIATASHEQASAISQINQAINQVSQVVQTNSATAEESASASEELSSQAEVLKGNVSKFKLKQMSRGFRYNDNPKSKPGFTAGSLSPKENNIYKEDHGIQPGPVMAMSKTKIILDESEFGKY